MPRIAKVKDVNPIIVAAVEAAQSPTPVASTAIVEFPAQSVEAVAGRWSEEGSTDREDLSMPQLALKQGIDIRFNDVRPGNFVWYAGDDYADLKASLTFVPLKWDKSFIERRAVDGQLPIQCDTKEQMEVEHNGTLEWGRPDKVAFSPQAKIMMLLIDAKGLPINALTLALGKKNAAPVVFTVKNTSYEVARAINSNMMAAKFRRESDPKFWDYSWHLGSVLKPSQQGGQYAVPTIKLGPPTTMAERKELATVAANL